METDLTQRLPEDVLAAVLRCLPPHSLAAARCVCKAWHAIIDARRLLDLFPPSLAGLFINFCDLDFSEFFFRPPGPRHTAVRGKLHRYMTDKYDAIVVDHCNGLLLFCNKVVNPATRSWAPLPPPPPAFDDDFSRGREYIVFDPAISPHYKVLMIPPLPWRTTEFDSELEWPPSPFIMHVFSSATRNWDWEERSFARRGGAIGTVADLRRGLEVQQAAYWRGELYVFCKFVMRISLSNCTYQAIKPPIAISTSGYQEICLGRSENGVYFASFDRQCQLRVWILYGDEMEWVLKHDNTLDHMLSRGIYDPQVQGPWILENIHYNFYHSTSPINITQVVKEDEFEWNSDNENTVDTRRRVEKHYHGGISILGYHPYKEVIFLNESYKRGLAYHLNSSKLEDLGSIFPKDYISYYCGFVEQSFPYTPCWIGKLPGSY